MKVLITGVAGGLGKYLSENFIMDGFKVIGTDMLPFDRISPELRENLSGYYMSDLSKEDNIQGFIQCIFSDNNDISIIINNAGLKIFKTLNEISSSEFLDIIKVNFLVPALITKESLKYLGLKSFGRIINIASNAGFEGYKKGSAYCSSKGALHLFTQSVADELRDNITINVISPETFVFPDGYDKTFKKFGSGLIHPSRIYKQIRRIIDGNFNGRIIPVLCFRSKIKYFLKDFFGSFKWLFG